MTIKFNLTATIEVPNADKFPQKEEIEKSIAEMFEFEESLRKAVEQCKV